MNSEPAIQPVLDRYGSEFQPRRTVSLGGAGGFSGALFWRLDTPAGDLCLRRWPPGHPTLERLTFLHGVLDHVWRSGFQIVPRPFRTSSGETHVFVESHFWELTPWLPGSADYQAHPSEARLRAALIALARFHVAAVTYPGESMRVAPSPGLKERLAMLQQLLTGGCDQIAGRLDGVGWPDFVERARRLIPLFRAAASAIEAELRTAAPLPLAQQPVIRDVWHDHVLFVADEVTGLVDFGAMRIDTPAGDVGRLLGSLARDDADAWRIGMSAYESIRPLSPDEHRAVRAFDRSTVLLSGMNWLRWIVLDGRTFDDRTRVLARLDENLSRMEHLLNCQKDLTQRRKGRDV